MISTELIGMNETKAYTAGQKGAQMLRDICGWLNINSMRAEKVSHPYSIVAREEACLTRPCLAIARPLRRRGVAA